MDPCIWIFVPWQHWQRVVAAVETCMVQRPLPSCLLRAFTKTALGAKFSYITFLPKDLIHVLQQVIVLLP